MSEPQGGIERARGALARGEWAQAYDGFRAADRSLLSARDLEGFADAAWWMSELGESLQIRHKAYAAYVASGDEPGAAGVAARLSIEHFVRDEPSVGAGFLERARRHAQHVPEGPEHGFLTMVEANVARFGGDLDGALALAQLATRIGERFTQPDLVGMAIFTEGVILVDAGRVPEGLARMDEAMAAVLAGELTPYFTGIIYCGLIAACLEVGDVRRAGEWNDAAREWCDTLPPGSPFPGMCRVNRAELARLRGAWAEAEAEATLASEALVGIEPGLAAPAFAQVGEIRRRRGDLEAADAAFARARELGASPEPGSALLRLAQGKLDAARASLAAALEAEHQPPRRVRLLAARVEIALAAEALDEAGAAAEELERMARPNDTPAFEASAAAATGAVLLARGDPRAATERLRAACTKWQQLKLPYEAAKARVMLGQALFAAGDREGSEAELRAALAAFERLGAAPDAETTARLLAGPGVLPRGLTAREAEVLRLVAAGKTNRDIAVELVISEHTVARHLQNMFAKLDVSSRAAATAFAYEHGLS